MLFRKAAIIGVGLIGGSLGAALRGRKLVGEVCGIGYRTSTLSEAKRRGCVDDFTLDLGECVRGASLVVIATPVSLVAEKAREAAESISPDCIVTDVASTKKLITEQVDAILAGKARYVGSHPMAGSEKRGAVNADKDLFDGALCIVIQTPKTDKEALKTIGEMWRSVGADTLVMSPGEHDRRVALASHVPHVTAAGLVNIQNDGSLECAASGFADTTRIAGSDPRLWSEICLSNAEEIVAGIDRLMAELASARELIEKGDEQALMKMLEKAGSRRQALSKKKTKTQG